MGKNKNVNRKKLKKTEKQKVQKKLSILMCIWVILKIIDSIIIFWLYKIPSLPILVFSIIIFSIFAYHLYSGYKFIVFFLLAGGVCSLISIPLILRFYDMSTFAIVETIIFSLISISIMIIILSNKNMITYFNKQKDIRKTNRKRSYKK